jgi:hypothetical protein
VFVPKEIPAAQQSIMSLTCPGAVGCPAGMAFQTRVIVGAHPTIAPQIFGGENRALFTYVWRIESSGTSGRARQQGGGHGGVHRGRQRRSPAGPVPLGTEWRSPRDRVGQLHGPERGHSGRRHLGRGRRA